MGAPENTLATEGYVASTVPRDKANKNSDVFQKDKSMFTPCQRLKNKTKTKDFVLSDRPFITRHYALSGLAVRRI